MYKIISVLLTVHLFGVCHAAELCHQELVLDLETAWHRTISYAPSIVVADEEIAIRESEKKQASLRPNPVAAVEAEDVLGTGPYKGWESAQTTYSIYQSIELGGKRGARTRFADSQAGVAFWDAQITRQNLRYELATVFINTYIAQEKVKLAKERELIAERTFIIVEAQVQAGKVSPIQRRRARIILKSSQIATIEAFSQLMQAKKRLASMWGCPCPDFDTLAFNLFEYLHPPHLCQIAPGLSSTPDVAKSQQQIFAASKNLKLQKANRIPDVTLRAGYRTYGDTSDHAYVLEAQIPIPIFNQNQGNIQKARQEINQASFRQEELLRSLRERLAVAYEQWVAAFDKAEVFQNGVLTEAMETFNLTQQGYQKGKLQYLDLLDAQRTLFEIQEQYLDVLNAYHLRKAEIERLSGEYNCKGDYEN